MDLRGKKILVVDDEEGFREILTEEFQLSGADVMSSASGIGAFEIFRTEKFDAIVSDVRMPNGDGIFFLDQILNSNFKLPIFVFISGYAEFDEKVLKEKGVSAIFSKPFEIDDVIKFLSAELESGEAKYLNRLRSQ